MYRDFGVNPVNLTKPFHTSLSQLYQTKKHHVGNFGMYPKKDTIRVLKIMNRKYETTP